MSLVVELVVGVHDPAQVDAADLLGAALALHVVEHPVDDATDTTLVLQVVDVFWGTSGGESGERLSGDGSVRDSNLMQLSRNHLESGGLCSA